MLSKELVKEKHANPILSLKLVSVKYLVFIYHSYKSFSEILIVFFYGGFFCSTGSKY